MKRITVLLAILLLCNFGYSQRPDTAYRIIEASYIGLNIADYALTINGLNKGAYEANPLLKNANPYTMAGVKLASTAAVVVLGRMAYKDNPKAAKITMIGLSVLTGLVVTNNIVVTIKINQ